MVGRWVPSCRNTVRSKNIKSPKAHDCWEQKQILQLIADAPRRWSWRSFSLSFFGGSSVEPTAKDSACLPACLPACPWVSVCVGVGYSTLMAEPKPTLIPTQPTPVHGGRNQTGPSRKLTPLMKIGPQLPPGLVGWRYSRGTPSAQSRDGKRCA